MKPLSNKINSPVKKTKTQGVNPFDSFSFTPAALSSKTNENVYVKGGDDTTVPSTKIDVYVNDRDCDRTKRSKSKYAVGAVSSKTAVPSKRAAPSTKYAVGAVSSKTAMSSKTNAAGTVPSTKRSNRNEWKKHCKDLFASFAATPLSSTTNAAGAVSSKTDDTGAVSSTTNAAGAVSSKAAGDDDASDGVYFGGSDDGDEDGDDGDYDDFPIHNYERNSNQPSSFKKMTYCTDPIERFERCRVSVLLF